MATINRTIPSLTPNTSYIARVRALNSFGISSDWSEALLIKTQGDSSTPNPPTNLVVDFTTGDLVISWDAPEFNTDGTIFNDFKNYEVKLIGSSITKIYTTTAEFFILTLENNISDFSLESSFNIEIRTVDVSDNKSTPLTGNTTKGVVASPDQPPTIYRGFTLLNISMPVPTGATDVSAYVLEHSTDGVSYTVVYDGPNSSFTHEVQAASRHYYRYKIKDSFGDISPSYSPVAQADSLGNLIINYGNYCVNSSFEIGPDIATGWRVFGAGTPSIDTGISLYGSKSQKLDYSGLANCGVEQTIVLPIDTTAPTDFTASFYIRTNATGRTGRIQIRDEINNNTYDSSAQPLSQNAWTRVIFTQTLPAGVSKFFIRAYCDNAASSQSFWFDGAQVEQGSSPSAYAPRAVEIPDNYIQSAHIAELSADKISTGSISTAVISMADDGVIQSFNGASGYQITATGATFQNGYINMVGAGGTVTFDSSSLRAIYSGQTKFQVDNTGVYIGGSSTLDANVYFSGSKTVFQDTSGTYDFIIDTSQTRVMRLTNGTTDVFYLDKNGNVSVVGALAGGTIDIGGNDATSFHVDVNGQMWSGAASFSSAPFRVSSTGQVTATQFVGPNVITGGSGDYLKSSNYIANSTGWIIKADGSVEFNNALLRGELLVANNTDTKHIKIYQGGGNPIIELFNGTYEGGAWQLDTRVVSGTVSQFYLSNSWSNISGTQLPLIYLDYDTSNQNTHAYMGSDNQTELFCDNGPVLLIGNSIQLLSETTTVIDNVPSINASSVSNVAAGSSWSQGNANLIMGQTFNATSDGSGNVSINFPNSFNGVFSVNVQNVDGFGASPKPNTIITITGVTTSGFTAKYINTTSGAAVTSTTLKISYIALGW